MQLSVQEFCIPI